MGWVMGWVMGVGDWPNWLRVVIETPGDRPGCECLCGASARDPRGQVRRPASVQAADQIRVAQATLALHNVWPLLVRRRSRHRDGEVRRRVQNQTCGHRGRHDDPLWRVRRRLSIAAERLTVDQYERLVGLLRAGNPRQEVWLA
jgi:hypothetical protein